MRNNYPSEAIDLAFLARHHIEPVEYCGDVNELHEILKEKYIHHEISGCDARNGFVFLSIAYLDGWKMVLVKLHVWM